MPPTARAVPPATLDPERAGSRSSSDAASAQAENQRIAESLSEMAALLGAQGGNPHRAAAYLKAAQTLGALATGVRDVFARDGEAGLDALPAIGPGIAAAIGEMLLHGRWRKLERLRGEVDAEALFRTIPGVGPQLAQRIHESLGVDSLEALELAARDGRLARLPGLGERRAAAIGASLARLLDSRYRLRRLPRPRQAASQPPLEWLLDVDREYRAGAAAGTLAKIAPRRFNPGGEAWLPVLHTQRADWHFTALYSNTERAHELGRVHDWVVIYAEDAAHAEAQATVVTPSSGMLAGRRVVRGREAECWAWYTRQPGPGSSLDGEQRETPEAARGHGRR
jgi:DNA polymerase (family X)